MDTKNIINTLYGKDSVWEDYLFSNLKVDVQGWNGNHPFLERFKDTFDYQIVLDLGVWKGQSTLKLASSLKSKSMKGCVIAVDTFLGSPEHHTRQLYSRHPGGRPNLYETFLSNIWQSGLKDYVVPLPQTTTGAMKILKDLKISPTFIHVDAAHEYLEVKKDIEQAFDILSPGGIMVCDDYCKGWQGVVKAVDEFSNQNNITVEKSFPKALLKKS